MRITEFAERSGLPVRSIRYYHQLGILPRPLMRGRVGWYSERHLERLELVRRMQARGYSLAAIADMVDNQVPAILFDDSDRTVLDSTDGAGAAAMDGDLDRIRLDELHGLVPPLADEPEHLARMLALGLLVPSDDDVFDVPQPPLLRAGITLVAQGVPLGATLRELEELQAELGAIASRFAAIVENDMLPSRPAHGRPPVETALELMHEVWPSVLVALGRVITDATEQAVRERLADR